MKTLNLLGAWSGRRFTCAGCLALSSFFAAACVEPASTPELAMEEPSPDLGPGAIDPTPGTPDGGAASSPDGGVAVPALPAQVSLLGRLTNREYLNSLQILLSFDAQDPSLVEDLEALPTESNVGGLRNDAETQILTQLAVAGFERVASAVADLYLSPARSNAELATLLGCPEMGAEAMSPCVVDFGGTLLAKASRRPRDAQHLAQAEGVLEAVNALLAAEDQQPTQRRYRLAQVKALIRYAALSPDFLLLLERGTPAADGGTRLTDYEIATRLAFFAAGSPPDAALLADAAAGRLEQAGTRAGHVDRLLETSEGRGQFVTALVGWLGIREELTEPEDVEALRAFVTDWLASDRPFADFYRSPVDVRHLDGSSSREPMGVLGSRAFLASHTAFPTPDFITRGITVVETLLCGKLPDGIPDEAFGAGELSAVEVFEVHSKQPCASCHIVFDNYGAVFQQFEPETNLFDATRVPFGSRFDLYAIGDVSGVAGDVTELGEALATSAQAPSCLARLFYRHALRRSLELESADASTLEEIVTGWRGTTDTSLRALLKEIVAHESFITLVTR